MARTKVVLPLLLALVFAFIGGVIAFKWAQAQKGAPVQGGYSADVIQVAVAAIDSPWGTKLTPELIKYKGFLKNSLPPGYFSDSAALASRVLAMPVKQDDLILESRLAPSTVTTGGISAVIAPGKRALAVKGDKIVGLAGMIRPHDRVDVLVTLQSRLDKQQMTKMVLENITVLAAGSQMQKSEKGEALVVDVYTLEVSPEEGEKLALASNEGKLQFALRSAVDRETVLTAGATISDTLNSYSKNTGMPEEKSFVMEIIRDKDRKREIVRF